jgi:hypothetical protein
MWPCRLVILPIPSRASCPGKSSKQSGVCEHHGGEESATDQDELLAFG